MHSDRFYVNCGLSLMLGLYLIAGVPASRAAQSSIAQASCRGIELHVVESTAHGAIIRTTSVAQPDIAENPLADEQARPHSGGWLWAVPFGTGSVEISVESVQWREAQPGEFSDSLIAEVLAHPLPPVNAANVMSLRGYPLTTVSINALQPSESGQSLRIAEALQVRLTYEAGGEQFDQRLESATAFDLLRGIVNNLDEVAPVPVRRPEPYLVILPPAYDTAAIDSFIDWKNRKGHTVTVATTSETGTTAQQIKAYIQTAYDEWAEPPVFVMLVGDVDGVNPLSGWVIDGFYTATIITDHPYTLLDGDDWFPDVFIGRLSVDSPAELQTVVNKIITYESVPYQPDGDWRNRMLFVGVRSTPQFFPSYNSAWPTLQWIGRKFLEWGYTDVDSVPYPPGNDQQVNQSVNAGVSFVAYRGFGSPHDWAMPPYTNDDVLALTNGQMLPVVMSIVCGGGAFDSSVDPCFGEVWLRNGTPTVYKGAIGFIGPSELDTKTRWNNTNIAGIFEGILHENVNCLGAAMLRGKMELIRQFPNNIDIIDSDSERSPWYYFHCYNLLGDPGLNFYVGSVRDLSATVPASASLGIPELNLVVNEEQAPLEGVWGTVVRNGQIFSSDISRADGRLHLALPQDAAGSVEVTLVKPRHEPILATLSLSSSASMVAASVQSIVDDGSHGSSGNADQIANPGERIAVRIRVRNYGGQSYAGGTLACSAGAPLAIVDGTEAVGTLAPGAESAELYFTLDVLPSALDGSSGNLEWNLGNGAFTWSSSVSVSGPAITVLRVQADNQDLNPEPNAAAALGLELSNTGHAGLSSSTVYLRSLDSRLTVTDSVANYAAIIPGGAQLPTNTFSVSVGDFYPGDWADVELVYNDGRANTVMSYALPIGNLGGGDPTHPDAYGYRAFQDSDNGYAESPTLSWYEINPVLGGPGTQLGISDGGPGEDDAVTVTLPFPFQFYGVTYTQIGVCSNGFIAFGSTDESYFRNYQLPAIASPDQMVAAFWDDLQLGDVGRICTYHDTQGHRFIVEWSRLENVYGNHPEETFQIMLYDPDCWPTQIGDGDILIQYLNISNSDAWDNYCTVGIQDRDQGYALPITYANMLEPGASALRSNQAILFTTGRPTTQAYVMFSGAVVDDDDEGGSDGNGDGEAQNGETIEMGVRLRNTGGAPAGASSGTIVSTDPRVTVLDANVSFPAIPPGEEVTGNAVRVTLAPSIPNGFNANFALSLTGGALPCVLLPTLTVYGPLISVLQPELNDDNVAPSNGNGNGELNPGETIELFAVVQNSGGNAGQGLTARLRRQTTNVTMVDTTATIGDVDEDEMVTAGEPLVFRVNNNVNDGSIVRLMIILRDQFGQEWSQIFSYFVGEPNLSAGTIRISDPVPGGNGDNRLVGNETGQLFPRIDNSGFGAATNVVVQLSTTDQTISLENATQVVGTIGGNNSGEPSTPIIVHVEPGTEPRGVVISVHVTANDGIDFTEQVSLTIGDVRFFADFDASTDGWSIFGSQGVWHTQSRQYVSAPRAFYCGEEGPREYPHLCDDYLRSPSFDFSGNGTIIFTTKYETESSTDVCRVQLQQDATTYFLLDSFWGDSLTWHERRYNLLGYPASEFTKIRFWFSSDAQGGNDEGWYVDNVIVTDEFNDLPPADAAPIPDEITFSQNYPNPFNQQTRFEYSIPAKTHVTIRLFDLTGRVVATLYDQIRDPGRYSLTWTPLLMGSGIYFARLDAGGVSLVRKVAYLK